MESRNFGGDILPMIAIWLVVLTILKHMKVSWDDDIPNIWTKKKCSKPPTSYGMLFGDYWPKLIFGDIWISAGHLSTTWDMFLKEWDYVDIFSDKVGCLYRDGDILILIYTDILTINKIQETGENAWPRQPQTLVALKFTTCWICLVKPLVYRCAQKRCHC